MFVAVIWPLNVFDCSFATLFTVTLSMMSVGPETYVYTSSSAVNPPPRRLVRLPDLS